MSQDSPLITNKIRRSGLNIKEKPVCRCHSVVTEVIREKNHTNTIIISMYAQVRAVCVYNNNRVLKVVWLIYRFWVFALWWWPSPTATRTSTTAVPPASTIHPNTSRRLHIRLPAATTARKPKSQPATKPAPARTSEIL